MSDVATPEIPKELKAKIEELNANVDRIFKELEPEIKKGEAAGKAVAELKEEVGKISEANAGIIETLNAAIEEARKEINDRQDEFETKFSKNGHGGKRIETPGSLIAKAMKESNFQARNRDRIIAEFEEWKTVTDLDASGGPLLVPQYLPGIQAPGLETLRVRDLLPTGRTTTSSIIFMRELVATSNAQTQTAQGETKGQSNITFKQETESVRTVGHFIVIALQMLDDAAQLRSYVDTRMRYMLDLEEERQLLVGDGEDDLHGVHTQATEFDETLMAGVEDAQGLDRIRKALLQVRLAFFPPSGIVLHDIDWSDLELLKDGEKRYIFARPQDSSVPRLWGFPVVATTSMPEGEFLTGAFRLGAQIWDRQQASVAVSTEDSDNFRKNLATLRAEKRLALTVYRPQAFVAGTMVAGT